MVLYNCLYPAGSVRPAGAPNQPDTKEDKVPLWNTCCISYTHRVWAQSQSTRPVVQYVRFDSRERKVLFVSDTPFDIVVIGAGPGGYVAAIRAAQLGLKVAIVERQYWGGVCLNIGCIPTKALLHTADLLDEARESKRFGVVIPDVSLDWAATQKYKDQVVKQMTGGVNFLMKKNNITTYNGSARITGRGAVQVTGDDGKTTDVTAKNIIVATGAKPLDLPKIGAAFDEDRILSSTGILSLKEVPKSLLVIGAGAIGIEFASAYRAFGSEVIVVEALPRVIPVEDEEISAELNKALTKRGIKIMTNTSLKSVERGDAQVVASVAGTDGNEQKLTAERILVGIGWQAKNNRGIGLEELGVEMDQRGFRRPSSAGDRLRQSSRLLLLQPRGRQRWHDRGQGA